MSDSSSSQPAHMSNAQSVCAECGGPDSPSHQRIWHDSAEGMTVSEPDPIAHSAEAMTVLREQGVDAYQAYVAEHDAP